MTYKKKTVVLLIIIAILSAIYILSFVFDPENRRGSAFAWLDQSLFAMADGIEIYGPEGRAVLRRRNDTWFFQVEASESQIPSDYYSPENLPVEFPVKQERVGDLFALLGRRDVYPVRASSSEGITRLGLTEENASRIIVRGGAGLPLLDLLIGFPDALGREIYLRRAGWNQIYSVEDDFSFFTESKPASWYDLRLFPQIATDTVQQAEIRRPDIGAPGEEPSAVMLRRSGGRWFIPGNENASVDAVRVETWLRVLLEAEGDDFGSYAPEEIEGTITLWFGDGSTLMLQTGPADEQGNRSVTISGSSFVYVVSERKFNSLFRASSYFVDNQ